VTEETLQEMPRNRTVKTGEKNCKKGSREKKWDKGNVLFSTKGITKKTVSAGEDSEEDGKVKGKKGE